MRKRTNSPEAGVRIMVSDRERQASKETEDYRYWPLEVLANHVQSIHLRLRDTDLPFLSQQFSIVCLKHRRVHPEITGVAQLFEAAARKLEREIGDDIQSVLPYIREVERCHTSGTILKQPSFGSVAHFAGGFRTRWDELVNELTTVREMAGAYDREAVGGLVVSQLTGRLDDLLHTLNVVQRLKLEIIFPKTVEMENTVDRPAR